MNWIVDFRSRLATNPAQHCVEAATAQSGSLQPVIDSLIAERGMSPRQAQMGLGCVLALMRHKLTQSRWLDLSIHFPEANFLVRRGLQATQFRPCENDELVSFLGLLIRLYALSLGRDEIFSISTTLARHLRAAPANVTYATAGSIEIIIEDASRFLKSDWYDAPELTQWLQGDV